MNLKELATKKRGEILAITRKYGARRIRLFGSITRGDERPDSDFDFLVELEAGRSLLDLGGMQMDLQELLGRKVDVVTEKGVRERIRDKIFQEAIPV